MDARTPSLTALSHTKLLRTEHHRKPSSIEGLNTRENIRRIPHDIHVAWHRLFRNMCALRIAQALHELANGFGYRISCIRQPHPLHRDECPVMRSCAEICTIWSCTDIKREAWFELQTLIAQETGYRWCTPETIRYINAHLIDSDYVLHLEKMRLTAAAE